MIEEINRWQPATAFTGSEEPFTAACGGVTKAQLARDLSTHYYLQHVPAAESDSSASE